MTTGLSRPTLVERDGVALTDADRALAAGPAPNSRPLPISSAVGHLAVPALRPGDPAARARHIGGTLLAALNRNLLLVRNNDLT
jgi:hypothetical protein